MTAFNTLLKQRKRERENRFFAEQFVPGETFFEGCGTAAALVTEVDIEGDDLIGIDLATGEERSCSLFHCGPVVLSPSTAMTIGFLGDTFTEMRREMYDTVFKKVTSEGGNVYNFDPKMFMQAMAERRSK